MNAQEYELAFVTALPSDVRVVEAHTLDFAKSPLGSLAFRYKHGWILINPLIPSRGHSGGGLARWHGHKSGGFTTGRFHKGADGKIHFKAEKNYGSKEEWEAEVKGSAATVKAKQAAVKAAVGKAENATQAAQKLEDSGASKAAQAVAHKVAADAHMSAAKAFQTAGEGPAHKSGALTHNAHGAIHASKATKLEEAAQAELAAAKLEQRKAAATKLGSAANELSAKTKTAPGTPKQKAELHQQAADAHKVAQAANEKAGNQYVASAHGKAAVKHAEMSAQHAQAHQQLETAAGAGTAKAHKASGEAEQSKGSLDEQITAHQAAAGAHGEAHGLHARLGNTENAQQHLSKKVEHNAAVQNLKQEKEALHQAHKEAAGAASAAQVTASGMKGNTPEAFQAHADASKAYMQAKEAATAAGLHGDAKDHHENAVAHLSKSAQIKKALQEKEAKKAEHEKLKADANTAYQAAFGMPETTPEQKQAKVDALEAATKKTGAVIQHGAKHDLPEDSLVTVKHEQMTDWARTLKEEIAKSHKANNAYKAASDEVDKASQKVITSAGLSAQAQADAHYSAAKAHQNAAAQAKSAGLKKEAKSHTDQATAHVATGNKKQAEANLKKKMAAEKAKKAAVKAKGLSGEAEKAGQTKEAVGKHLDAASAHLFAAEAAHKAGMTSDVEAFKGKAKEHVAKANQIGEKLKAADTEAAQKAASVPAPPVQTSPHGVPLKPVGQLTDTKRVLGTHGSQLMKDEAGNEWLKKNDTYSRVLDPSIASLQRKAGMNTPVFVKTKDGHLQGILPGAQDAFPNGNFNPEKLSQNDLIKMLQHQVLDYVTGNQDTHSGQWLRTLDGKLIQIDQGQAFKYGVGKASGGGGKGDPTTTYPPLGVNTPVYPKLWNAAKAGKIQIPDPNGTNGFARAIKNIQNIPDDQFKALFKPYAEEALKNGHKPGGHLTVDGFLADIVQHKNNIHQDFEKLYNELPPSGKAGSPEAKGVPAGGEAVTVGGLTPKQEALKKVADYSLNPPDNWSMKDFQSLKQAATEAGADATEVKAAMYSPEKFLKELPLPASATPATPAATSAPSAPTAKTQSQVDPFKPKAKWSKTQHKAKIGGGHEEVAALAGPKGLAVHKEIGKSGWAVSQPDGLKIGGGSFKTQKEAKLAAEWMAKNYGGKNFSETEFSKWQKENPDAFSAFKQGVLNAQWNKDAQAELDKIQGKTPPGGADQSAGALSAKEKALKALAEHALPENGGVWDYDKEVDLQQAAMAAGATKAEAANVIQKPKTYLKSVGVTSGATAAATAPSEPMVTFTGLGNNKAANAQLLKKLYDQAHSPNATAAMKAEYAKAQEAWQEKHSTGPFDPSKVVAPGQLPPLGSKPNPAASGPKKQIKTGGNPGFVPHNPLYGASSKYESKDPEVIAENTKASFPSSYERGYRMVPLSVSANGDWKPDDADKGPGTGAYIYSTSAYSSINMQLRGSPKQGIAPVGPKGGKWDDVIAHIDQIFDKAPPTSQKLVLSRKMDQSGVFPVPPPPLAKGAEYVEPGYSSTAKHTGTWAGAVQMEIRVPPGAKILDLNHTTGSDHASEAEVLLPRSTKYRIISDSWSEPGASASGSRHLVVEVVV